MHKMTAQAVEADAIDILAVQAPECKLLPDSLIELLTVARSSVLVYHNKQDDKIWQHIDDQQHQQHALPTEGPVSPATDSQCGGIINTTDEIRQ
jgi:hypothetical protein